MPEANISPLTDDETTAPAARTGVGASAAAGSREGGPVADSAPGQQQRERGKAAGHGPDRPSDPDRASGPDRAEPGARVELGGGADASGFEYGVDTEYAEDAEHPEDAADLRTGLTPRQARRVRIVVSGVVMVAVAVALAVRLRSAPSVLTVGFYGIALILSGVAIGLSRRGRTRVATGVLVLGFAAVALAEWLLASVA